MAVYACFDIGGIAIKYGVAEGSGRFLGKGNFANPVRSGGAGRMISCMLETIKKMQAEYELVGIAVSTASMVNPDTGVIIYANEKNFPGYMGVRLRDILTEKTGLPCTVENDVNCAAIGEWWLGAAKGVNSFFCLTVGTGLGGCLFIDGKVWHGVSGVAGEFGYMHFNGTTLERAVSTKWLILDAAGLLGLSPAEVDGEMLFAMAKAGNEKIQGLITAQMNNLAAGIANVCYVFNPPLVVLGGGIMQQADYLRPIIGKAFREKTLPVVHEKTRLEFARLGNTAGMVGALYNFRERMRNCGGVKWKSE